MSQEIELNYLELCLQQKLTCKELRVINYLTTKFLPPGENYSSSVVQLDVTFSRNEDASKEKISLICKAKTTSEDPYVEWVSILEKELFIYNELLPLYRELEREVGIDGSDLIDITTMCIGHCKTFNGLSNDVDDNSVLLLKNLNVEGYYIGDRHTGLNMEHASLALKSLARYHALGMAMKQKRPEFAKRAIDMAKSPEFDLKQMTNACEKCLYLFREHPCLNRHITVIEECYALFLAEKQFEAQNLEPASPWATMSHGDFWVNNMLFRRNEETSEVSQVKFIDFQMFLHTSALWDLPYFFCTSLDDTTVANHFTDLLNLYYENFVESLVRLDCDATFFTRQAFHIELKKWALYIFPLSALATKFIDLKVGEEYENNKELVATIFNDEATDAYVGRLQRLVQIYEDVGWF